MYYEINVSKDGQHFFATAERSITSRGHLVEVYHHLLKAFPPSKGYAITISRMETTGQELDPADL